MNALKPVQLPLLARLMMQLAPVMRPVNPRKRKPEPVRQVVFFHVSTHAYNLPGPGIDPHVDHLIASGELLLRGESISETGKVTRFAVSKGKTARCKFAKNIRNHATTVYV